MTLKFKRKTSEPGAFLEKSRVVSDGMESIWQPQILSLETSGDNSPRITALPPLPQALPPAPPHMDPNYAPVRRSRHDSAYTTNSTSRSSSRMSKSGGSTGGGGYTCPITGIQLFGRSKKAALKENLTPEEEIAQLKEVIESFESDLTRSSDTIVRQDKQIVRLESQMAYYKSKATVNTSPLMGSSESTVGGSDTSGSEQDSSSSGRRSISMMSMSDASSVHDLRVTLLRQNLDAPDDGPTVTFEQLGRHSEELKEKVASFDASKVKKKDQSYVDAIKSASEHLQQALVLYVKEDAAHAKTKVDRDDKANWVRKYESVIKGKDGKHYEEKKKLEAVAKENDAKVVTLQAEKTKLETDFTKAAAASKCLRKELEKCKLDLGAANSKLADQTATLEGLHREHQENREALHAALTEANHAKDNASHIQQESWDQVNIELEAANRRCEERDADLDALADSQTSSQAALEEAELHVLQLQANVNQITMEKASSQKLLEALQNALVTVQADKEASLSRLADLSEVQVVRFGAIKADLETAHIEISELQQAIQEARGESGRARSASPKMAMPVPSPKSAVSRSVTPEPGVPGYAMVELA